MTERYKSRLKSFPEFCPKIPSPFTSIVKYQNSTIVVWIHLIECTGKHFLYYSVLSIHRRFGSLQFNRRSPTPLRIVRTPMPQRACTPADRSATKRSLSSQRLTALLSSWACMDGRQRKQLLKYMPPRPSSSGATEQYTVGAAPCCCGHRNTDRRDVSEGPREERQRKELSY